MLKTVELIYIPGLGDGYDPLRRLALKYWKGSSIKTTFVPMRWRDTSETYEQKVQRIRRAVKASTADTVVLVGESSGGSVVVAEMMQQNERLHRAITICGKNVRADRVSPRIYANNPAFRESMTRADETVAKMTPEDGKKFTIFYSKADPTVWFVDTKVPHASYRTLPSFGHFLSITLVLFVFKRRIIKEATKPI